MTAAARYPAGDQARRCGDCVHWNGRPSDAEGGCASQGMRSAQAPSCALWFSRDQLNAALYGRNS